MNATSGETRIDVNIYNLKPAPHNGREELPDDLLGDVFFIVGRESD